MQIHELNNFNEELGAGAYVAVDNGDYTGKASIGQVLDGVNKRIDNIIGNPAPTAEEIIDARIGGNGGEYTTLGNAIRNQFLGAKNEAVGIGNMKTYIAVFGWEMGSIGAGQELESVYRIRTTYIPYNTNSIYKFVVAPGYKLAITYYDKDKNYIREQYWITSNDDISITASEDGYIRLVIGEENDENIDTGAASNVSVTATDPIVAYMNEFPEKLTMIRNGGYYEVPFEYNANGYIDQYNGNVVSYNGWKYTDYVKIDDTSNGKIKISMVDGSGSPTVDGGFYNAWYDGNKSFIGQLIITNGEIAVPGNAVYLRLSCRSFYNQTIELYSYGTKDIHPGGGSETSGSEYLKFATWNVGIFNDGTTKPSTADAPAQIVKLRKTVGKIDADILNAQEYVDYVDSSNTLASANLLAFKYPSKVSRDADKCFSKLKILSYETITFTSGSGRPCIAYTVDVNGKEVTIINAHLSIELDPSAHRNADIAQLISYMSDKDYVILSGDFNVASDSEFDPFKTEGFVLCNGGDFGWFDTWPVFDNMPSGWSTDWPCYHLDNIIVSSNIIPQYVEAVEADISDHAPLVATLRID